MALSTSPRKTIPLASGDVSRQRCHSSASATASVTKRVFFCAVVIEGSEKGRHLPEGRVLIIRLQVATKSMQKFRILCSPLARRFRQVLPICCHLVPDPLRTTLLVLVTSYLLMHIPVPICFIMLLCTTISWCNFLRSILYLFIIFNEIISNLSLLRMGPPRGGAP